MTNKPSVLLVDDVEANLLSLEGILVDMNCNLVRARNGNDALRELLKREFAVVLLDVQMPGMDGYEVARLARSDPATKHIPIIFLTAKQDTEASMMRGYGSGAVDFLLKPINVPVLRAKVHVFLDLYENRQTLANEVAAHRKTLDTLELANTALRDFAQAAAHELRAPLRATRAFLDMLATHASSKLDAQEQNFLDRSRSASRRMDSLLDALAVYAGLQRPPANVAVDCGRVLENVLADLQDHIEAKHAEVLIGELAPLRGDPDRVYQLLLNLVGNALKFVAPGVAPRVRVSMREQARHVTLCVEDNGIGIDKKHHEGVFGAFQRLHDNTQYEGSGLGLAICKQIVHQLGGRLWVDSELGRGARFYARFDSARNAV